MLKFYHGRPNSSTPVDLCARPILPPLPHAGDTPRPEIAAAQGENRRFWDAYEAPQDTASTACWIRGAKGLPCLLKKGHAGPHGGIGW